MVFIIFTWPLSESNHWRYYIFAQISWVWCPRGIHTWALIIYSLYCISSGCDTSLQSQLHVLCWWQSSIYAINPNRLRDALPCGSVLSIFSHATPETCLKALLGRPRCCILHRILWSNHPLVTASHLQGLNFTSQRKQGIKVLLWIIICHLVVTTMKFVTNLLSPLLRQVKARVERLRF